MPNRALLAMIVAMVLCAAAAPLWASPAPSGPEMGARNTEAAPPPKTSGSPPPSPSGSAGGEKQDGGGGGGGGGLFGGQTTLLLVMVGFIVLMLVLSSRSRRKQAAQRQSLLAGMKKGDRVTTVGGVIGTLVEVRETEVVVKVDEQNNTRMRFLKSAISHVGETPAEKEAAKS